MLRDFARQIAEVFPAIDQRTARDYLGKFWQGNPPWQAMYASSLPRKLCQGDIVSPITFIVQGEDGELEELDAHAILVSHSCDMDNDANLVLAACRPFSQFRNSGTAADIRRNTLFGALYLNAVPVVGEIVVDFGIMQSVRTKNLLRSIEEGDVKRISSFTDLGYYFFVAKLTVRFLRPKPDDEGRMRDDRSFLQRIGPVLKDARVLLKYLLKGSRSLDN